MEAAMQTFGSQDLQRQASAIQEAAMREPVIITYHDRPRFVMLTMQEYDRLRGRKRTVGAVTDLPDSAARQIEALAETVQEPDEEMEMAPSHGRHP
jgi:prevent-host-death family protein